MKHVRSRLRTVPWSRVAQAAAAVGAFCILFNSWWDWRVYRDVPVARAEAETCYAHSKPADGAKCGSAADRASLLPGAILVEPLGVRGGGMRCEADVVILINSAADNGVRRCVLSCCAVFPSADV